MAPWNEDEWLSGDDEQITWDEYIELPESRTTLIVETVNEDPVYDHAVIIRIVTMPKELVTPVRLLNQIYIKLDRVLSGLLGLGRRRRVV